MRLYQKFYARLLKKWSDRPEDPRIVAFKREAFGSLSGTVAEIGPGAGTNLKHLPTGIRWIGIEPNALANDTLRAEAQRQGLYNIEIHNTAGEHLPLADNSADVVVATRVLCSVDNPTQVLAEIHRVLKPTGKYIFVEHIAAPRGSGLRALQNLINPFNRLFVGNCHTNRETLATIRAAGFASVSVQEDKIKLSGIPYPHIWGSARK